MAAVWRPARSALRPSLVNHLSSLAVLESDSVGFTDVFLIFHMSATLRVSCGGALVTSSLPQPPPPETEAFLKN